MNTSNIFQKAATNALATAVYVTVVGLFMSHASSIFGEHDKVVTPVVVLMLLVLSAAVTGSLLFGAPAMYYVDGKKKEALQLLAYTLASFAVLTLLAMFILAIW